MNLRKKSGNLAKDWRHIGKVRRLAVIVASVFVGLVLLVAGTGKVPGQTEFAQAMAGTFITPAIAEWLSRVVPWTEIVLGACLILGILPRIAAILTLPLIAGFMANNTWALAQGIGVFTRCSDCFGFWEKFLGPLSPAGALTLDILLFVGALSVALLSPEFLRPRLWFARTRA